MTDGPAGRLFGFSKICPDCGHEIGDHIYCGEGVKVGCPTNKARTSPVSGPEPVRDACCETGVLPDARPDHAQTPDYVRKLEAENAALRAFAASFHVTVVDNFFQDVTLVLEQPHSLAIRLRNDSTKSWIFADLEARRKAALSKGPDTSTDRTSK